MDNKPFLETYHDDAGRSANDSEISEAYYERYRQRREGLRLIRQLIELLSLIQQHRASSLAVLGGTTHFRQRTYGLQRSIHEKAAQLQDSGEGFDRQRWRAILTEWFTIKGHWHKDDPLDNFELHNYLIEQLALLIWDTAKGSELMSDSMRGSQLSEFAFKHLINYIESLGRLRGLSTYVTSRGLPEDESSRALRRRLSHLHQVCEDTSNRHQQALSQLPSEFQHELDCEPPLVDNLQLTQEFLNLVRDAILEREVLKVDSDEVFYHATRAIEAELRLFHKAIECLETAIEQQRLAALSS